MVGNPRVLTQDIYVITEILMTKLDKVFVCSSSPVVFGLTSWSDVLLSVASDVDCVGQTRTCLFHGVEPTPDEGYRCVQSAERLCKRLLPREKETEEFGGFLEDMKTKMKVS